jgi:hypothetical protein
MSLERWTMCAVVAVGAGCGSVQATGRDAAAGSGAGSDPGGSEGAAHPDAGVPADAGAGPDAGTSPPPGPTRCSQTGCDNLDPTQSLDAGSGAACSTSATTATGGSLGADGGTLELRWGPSCMVNWARFTPGTSGQRFRIWASRQSPAFDTDRYEFTTSAGLDEFSNEVYAPGAARACIEQWNGSTWVNPICTPWI